MRPMLDEIKSWMSFWGWTHEGGPGAIKHNVDGNVIGRHGDPEWRGDVKLAEAKFERQRAAETAN